MSVKMTDIETIKLKKGPIINQMLADYAEASEEDRYFSIKNVEDCANDLDQYIELLLKSNKQQKEISKSIKWIFKQLSTFKQEQEDLEFLWGFIYNGYTDELSNFILEAAFVFGMERAKSKIVKTNNFYLKHNPHTLDAFRLYIGSTANNGVILEYRKEKGCFEFVENPYGDSYGMPVFDLQISDNYTELSFDVLTAGAFKTIVLKAQKPVDSILLQAIGTLNNKNAFLTPPVPDFCNLELELTKGVLTCLSTLNYDKNNSIINMFTEGTGMKILVQELDANNKFQHSDDLASHPAIVSEKFIVIYAVPNWKYFEIDELTMTGTTVSVRTGRQKFAYENEQRNNVIAAEIENLTLNYELRTYDFIRTILADVLRQREAFKSRFDN